MSSYTEVDLYTLDLDWFAVDSQGHIGHFASSGTYLVPKIVVESKERCEDVADYFENLPQKKGRFTIAQHLLRWGIFLHEPRYQHYVEAFSEFAERGCFSFDCRMVHRNYPGPYFVAALPTEPLKLSDLPGEIAESIRLLTLPFAFDEASVIGMDEFLAQKWMRLDKQFRIQIGPITLK